MPVALHGSFSPDLVLEPGLKGFGTGSKTLPVHLALSFPYYLAAKKNEGSHGLKIVGGSANLLPTFKVKRTILAQKNEVKRIMHT